MTQDVQSLRLLTFCRIRRIKCDGCRPCCRRCSETGRTCDGFPSDQCALRPVNHKDKEESRSFIYFSEKTSLELSGHYDEVSSQMFALRMVLIVSGVLLAVSSLSNQLCLSSAPAPHCCRWRVTRITEASRRHKRLNSVNCHRTSLRASTMQQGHKSSGQAKTLKSGCTSIADFFDPLYGVRHPPKSS